MAEIDVRGIGDVLGVKLGKRGVDMKKRENLLSMAIVIELIFMIIVQHIYNNVLETSSLFALLITLLIFSISRNLDILNCRSKCRNKILLIGHVVILLFIPTYIFCSKPQYTYNKAINIVSSNFNESIRVGRNDYHIYVTDESEKLRKGYVISIDMGNEIIDYVFDPWEGVYLKMEEDE